MRCPRRGQLAGENFGDEEVTVPIRFTVTGPVDDDGVAFVDSTQPPSECRNNSRAVPSLQKFGVGMGVSAFYQRPFGECPRRLQGPGPTIICQPRLSY